MERRISFNETMGDKNVFDLLLLTPAQNPRRRNQARASAPGFFRCFVASALAEPEARRRSSFS
jgi:hypothetical protein